MLSHTPPKFTPGSYDQPMFNKRMRTGSISGRLRSASDLCDEGIITPQEKGIIKDLIITGDPELETALETYENGDPKELQGLLRGGSLQRRRASIDLLADDLDMGVLNVGSLDEDKPDGAFNFDDIPFHPSMSVGDQRNKPRADSFSDVFGSSFALGGSFGAGAGVAGRGVPQQSAAAAAAAASAAAAAPAAFTFGHTPPDHVFADDVLDGDSSFPGFAGMSFPDVAPMAAAAPPTDGTATPLGGSATASGGSATATARNGSGGGARGGGSTQTARSGSSRAVSAPISIPGAKKKARGAKPSSSGRKIGAYSPEARRLRVARYLEKRKKRVWTKKVKYDVRKNFADSRLRVKGRFVKKEDEALLRELIQMT